MKFDTGSQAHGWFRAILQGVLEPQPSASLQWQQIGRSVRQLLALTLSVLMVMIPMGQGTAFAQSGQEQTAPPMDDGQQAPQGQPLSAEQLDQLVAPIALYPDALVAQVLAAATYPTQVVEADRWRQAQGNATPEQIAAGADTRNWDPSVKALTAFPTVLAQMDKNLQWTTDLGNAYYNQPQDVMDSVQAMRQKAQNAGQLRNTQQQTVSNEGGTIAIAPANPTVVYVPVYDPWVVYGPPLPMYPGYYYYPPPGVFFGGLAIGFGIGIGIGYFSHWGWGWNHWGMGWRNHSVFYNHNTYITRSTTVINHGYNRPGGPPRGYGVRGAYARPSGGFNRQGGTVNRPGVGYRGTNNVSRPSGISRPSGTSNVAGRNAGTFNRPGSNVARPGGSYGRPTGNVASRAPSTGHTAPSASRPSGASHPSGGARSSGAGRSGGGGGHEGHGK